MVTPLFRLLLLFLLVASPSLRAESKVVWVVAIGPDLDEQIDSADARKRWEDFEKFAKKNPNIEVVILLEPKHEAIKKALAKLNERTDIKQIVFVADGHGMTNPGYLSVGRRNTVKLSRTDSSLSNTLGESLKTSKHPLDTILMSCHSGGCRTRDFPGDVFGTARAEVVCSSRDHTIWNQYLFGADAAIPTTVREFYENWLKADPQSKGWWATRKPATKVTGEKFLRAQIHPDYFLSEQEERDLFKQLEKFGVTGEAAKALLFQLLDGPVDFAPRETSGKDGQAALVSLMLGLVDNHHARMFPLLLRAVTLMESDYGRHFEVWMALEGKLNELAWSSQTRLTLAEVMALIRALKGGRADYVPSLARFNTCPEIRSLLAEILPGASRAERTAIEELNIIHKYGLLVSGPYLNPGFLKCLAATTRVGGS